MKNKTPFKTQNCRNCGLNGHIYKNCPHPIISFGIICYKIEKNEIKYLMIQRKDSLSFMEFVRGKYELSNIEYIKKLLLNMTISERDMIITNTFENIWNYIWFQTDNNSKIDVLNIVQNNLKYKQNLKKYY